jgi:DNA polymerase-3 subunit gamma/tau
MLTMPANETDEKKKIIKKEEKPSFNPPELVRNGKVKYKPSTPSIGRIINGKVTSATEQQDADQAQNLANKTRKEKQIENFSKEELMEKWLRFAEMMRKEKPRMATALKASNPVIKDDFAIEIEMSNKVQENDFNLMIKADLANFLRQELKNDNLKIVTFVLEINNDKSLYTDEDKYKYLSEKNPNINELKQRLNLDFE